MSYDIATVRRIVVAQIEEEYSVTRLLLHFLLDVIAEYYTSQSLVGSTNSKMQPLFTNCSTRFHLTAMWKNTVRRWSHHTQFLAQHVTVDIGQVRCLSDLLRHPGMALTLVLAGDDVFVSHLESELSRST